MKKRDIWISVAIVAAAVVLLLISLQRKGQIKIDAGGAVANMQVSNNWLGNATISSAAPPGKVSARLHRPRWLKLSMQQDGDTWRLESRGPWGDLSKIGVKSNDTTVLKLGPPFQIKPKVRFTGTKVSIDFNIIGSAGEHYRNVIMQNDKRAPAPGVKIIDQDGSVLATGKFAYG